TALRRSSCNSFFMRIVLCPQYWGHPEWGSGLDGPHGVEGGPSGASIAAGSSTSGSALGALQKGFPPLVVAPVDRRRSCSPCIEAPFEFIPNGRLFRIDAFCPLDNEVDETHRLVLRLIFHSRGVEHVRNQMAYCRHKRGMQCPVASTRCEGCDACRLNVSVQCAVPAAERLEMRAVPCLGVVEDRNDKAAHVSPPDAARRLDVLCDRLWLTVDEHQPQSRDVDADTHHVSRKHRIDCARSPNLDIEKVEHL